MLYSVTFYDKDKTLRTLDFDQPSEEAVIIFLKRQGVTPVSIALKKEKKSHLRIPGFGKISLVEKETMSRHFSTLVKIGMPLLEAVELLSEGTKNQALLAIYRDLSQSLQEGQQFSAVFANHPKDFPESFTAVLRVGEASGTLDQSFSLLAEQLGRERVLYGKVKSALIYPIILTVSVISLILLIVLFVMPRIAQVFGSFGTEIPALTKFLITSSNFLRKNVLLSIVLFGIIPAAGIVALILNKKIRRFSLNILLQLPLIRNLVVKLRLARISRGLHTMTKAGLPITEALEVTANGLSGTPYKTALLEISKDVQKGITLASAMKSRPALFPGMFVGMMRVGERTATLSDILDYMAEFYERESAETLESLTALLEPALLIIIGIVVLLIALAVLVPIYKLVSSIQ